GLLRHAGLGRPRDRHRLRRPDHAPVVGGLAPPAAGGRGPRGEGRLLTPGYWTSFGFSTSKRFHPAPRFAASMARWKSSPPVVRPALTTPVSLSRAKFSSRNAALQFFSEFSKAFVRASFTPRRMSPTCLR